MVKYVIFFNRLSYVKFEFLTKLSQLFLSIKFEFHLLMFVNIAPQVETNKILTFSTTLDLSTVQSKIRVIDLVDLFRHVNQNLISHSYNPFIIFQS